METEDKKPFWDSEEIRDAISEVEVELNKVKQTREVPELALDKIYLTRYVDKCYSVYLTNFKGRTLIEKQELVKDYQLFNRYISFYTDSDSAKLYHGVAEDIIDNFVDKVVTTPLKIKNDNSNGKNFPLNISLLEKIVQYIAECGTFLVVLDKKTILSNNKLDIPTGEIISGNNISIIENVKLYKPHEYDIDEKVVFTYDEKNKLVKTSFANEKYTEVVGKSLIGNKRELIYLLSMIITSFGTETEIGRMRIHADERYGSNLARDIFHSYNQILKMEDAGNELFKMTQGDIRAVSWQTAIETLVSLVSKSLGIDLRAIVYTTATQTNMQSIDDEVKINNYLKVIAKILDKIIYDLIDVSVTLQFDKFSLESINDQLQRLYDAWNNQAIEYETYIKQVNSLLNITIDDNDISKAKVQHAITPTTTKEMVEQYPDDENR